MANEYVKALQSFETSISEGIEIKNSFAGTRIVTEISDWLHFDQKDCLESWLDHLDTLGLEALIEIDEALEGEGLIHVLERRALDSWINGQKRQFFEEFTESCNRDDFLDFIDGNRHEIAILKYLVSQAF